MDLKAINGVIGAEKASRLASVIWPSHFREQELVTGPNGRGREGWMVVLACSGRLKVLEKGNRRDGDVSSCCCCCCCTSKPIAPDILLFMSDLHPKIRLIDCLDPFQGWSQQRLRAKIVDAVP